MKRKEKKRAPSVLPYLEMQIVYFEAEAEDARRAGRLFAARQLEDIVKQLRELAFDAATPSREEIRQITNAAHPNGTSSKINGAEKAPKPENKNKAEAESLV